MSILLQKGSSCCWIAFDLNFLACKRNMLVIVGTQLMDTSFEACLVLLLMLSFA